MMATYNNDANSYGFSSSPLYSQMSSSPYSSTPSSLRPPRPRFGYSGPSSYPRPRSSASKPNSDSPLDSMANNYGSSTGSLLSTGSRPLDDTYESDSSKFYSANESGFKGNDYNKPDLSAQYPVSNYQEGNSFLGQRENNDYQAPNYYDRFQKSNSNYQPLGQPAGYPPAANFQSDSNKPYFENFANKPILSNPNFNKLEFNNPTFNKPDFSNPDFSKPTFSTFNKPNFFKPNFSKFNSNKTNFNKPFKTTFSSQKFGKPKKMAEKGTWHCEVCSMDFNSDAPLQMHLNGARHAKKLKTLDIVATTTTTQNQGTKGQWHCGTCTMDFTSQATLDMHLNGAKHAKKLKAKDTLNTLQNKGTTAVEAKPGKELFCAVCNIQANSSLQLQMHLDGTKHKNKVKGDSDSKPGTKSELNGNGSVTRPLPSDFDEPQAAKLMKFSCDICNISVNSNVQLQQHLTSKKHEAKVEGKPILKGKKKKAAAAEISETIDEPVAEPMETNQTDVKIVKGVQNLSTSFVQGETI